MLFSRLIIGCFMILFGLVIIPADAKPKAKAKPMELTSTEKLCHDWGTLAREIARERDKNLSLVLVLGTVRGQLAAGDAEMQRLATQLVYTVYANGTISPQRIQRDFEIGCLLGATPPATRY